MKIYMCKTDAAYHLGEDADGVWIFFSVESLKKKMSCWVECGIVEMDLDTNTVKVICSDTF